MTIEPDDQEKTGDTPQNASLWATSGYGFKTRKPFITIHWKDVVVQLSPEEARRFARSIFEAAEAAEQDAFLFEWAKEIVGVDDARAAGLLHDYRAWREKQRSEPDGM